MKSHAIASRATSLLLLAASVAEAGHHGHSYPHNRQHLPHHVHHSTPEKGDTSDLEKRGGQCQFPTDAGLVAVTPKEQNAGWAMSPDQPCKPGNYCPYACPPGQVSMQWDPKATSYAYPGSMNGGLFCDESGQVSKPFPNKPYCADSTGGIGVKNQASGHVAFCQTVLPGNEAMLIPTSVNSFAKLAVPDPNYWCETAAHYYINPPGLDCDTACVWGTKENPWGNWSPYVAGANTDSAGLSYLKLGWNPIYLEEATPFRHKTPSFGVEVQCDGDCVGLPCKIDPSVNSVNEITGSATDGAGGAGFCVVTVPKGSSANIVVFDKNGGGGNDGGDGGNDGGDGGGDDGGDDTPTTTEVPPPPPPPTTTSTPEPVPTETEAPTSSYEPEPEPTTSSEPSTTSQAPTSSSSSPSSSWPSYTPSPSSSAQYTYSPHMFMESGVSTPSSSPSNTSPSAPAATHTGASTTLMASPMSLALGFLLAAIAQHI